MFRHYIYEWCLFRTESLFLLRQYFTFPMAWCYKRELIELQCEGSILIQINMDRTKIYLGEKIDIRVFDHFCPGFWAATAITSCRIEFLDFLKPTIATFYMTVPSQSEGARSSSCILPKRSFELTRSLLMTPHIQQIIARPLRCRRCKCDKVGAQVPLAWSMALLTHGL